MPDSPNIASSRPTFFVEDEVKADLSRDLVRLDIDEDTAGLKTLVARFQNVGPSPSGSEEQSLYLDGQTFDFGKHLKVSIGPGEGQTLFDGYVSAIEASFSEAQAPEVILCAEDKLMKLRTTRRMKTYNNKS